ncbi:ADP-ribose pyrophosphatase YjhB, NUDIX family [Micromonospora pattaloongensis]|uniref:ADP-ribose pyrophosphatase YjhB, NUDIX family n=1 Tax=Micromonospora pattaloongensis TaxID=405436 RepID=A0A1H3RKR6_9ACTN|nr:NUDIX hydrolase [Micromonospora pattaloongensis]SDZ26256.1 ADP-ribose pyrophosphatase YjhB, NUDIX family [Micromonospora pattaloongensis]
MTPRGYGSAAAYCPRCAAALAAAPPTRCAGCGYELFLNPRPTGGLVVLDGARFLALRRAAEPGAGRWELPGGFCDGREHPADAAVREGREELGVEVVLGEFVGMYLGDYEWQGELLPVLDCFFLATLDGGEITLDPAESTGLRWFALADPPPLAFPTMDAAVAEVRRRRRG